MGTANRTIENRGSERRSVRVRSAGLAAIMALAFVSAPMALYAQSAQQLLEEAESSVWPQVFEAEVMLRTSEEGEVTSEMVLSVMHSREEGTYMEISEPARSRGLRFLQIDESLWMYNPRGRSSRAIRLSPRASFQGSTFSNRDLSDPQFTDDYDVSIVGREMIDHYELGEVDAIVLEADARDESVAYARIRLWVRGADSLLLRGEYFAKSGLLFKRSEFGGVQDVMGRIRPTEVRMVSEQSQGTESTMRITLKQMGDSIPARIFTQTYLTR